jgi:hypothetical protein
MQNRLLKWLAKGLAALAVLIAAGLAFAYWFSHPGRGPRMDVNPNEKGYVEEIEGTTVLHLKGSPYEMGFQHGALARDQVRKAMARVDELLDKAKEEFGLPRFASEFLLGAEYRLCMPYGSESYDHRYKGMAADIKTHFGAIDEKTALEILKNAAMRNTNLHSVLCNSTDREIWVAHAKGKEDAWKQPYVHYELKKLFLRPDKRQ